MNDDTLLTHGDETLYQDDILLQVVFVAFLLRCNLCALLSYLSPFR